MIASPRIAHRLVYLSSLIIVMGCTSVVWSKDFNKEFEVYTKGPKDFDPDVALRSRYDANGVILTYEAYADLRSDGQNVAVANPGIFKEPRTVSHSNPTWPMGSAQPTYAFIPTDPNIQYDHSDESIVASNAGRTGADKVEYGSMAVVGDYAFRNPAFLGGFADVSRQMPTVHIVVSPNPPPDYSVSINGRTYPTTAKALYIVSGTISIVVTRSGKLPCLWAGTPVPEKVQEVACPL